MKINPWFTQPQVCQGVYEAKRCDCVRKIFVHNVRTKKANRTHYYSHWHCLHWIEYMPTHFLKFFTRLSR